MQTGGFRYCAILFYSSFRFVVDFAVVVVVVVVVVAVVDAVCFFYLFFFSSGGVGEGGCVLPIFTLPTTSEYFQA